MAKKRKQAEGPKGAAPWMATFSDLMNLLLCFFVLLFSMSTVDSAKFEMLVASLQSKISIFDGGGMNIGEGDLIGAGIRQLEFLDSYYNDLANSQSQEEGGGVGDDKGQGDFKEQYEQEALKESEGMAEDIQAALEDLGAASQVEVDFDEQYVMLNLSGAILFESGKAEIMPAAFDIINKIGVVLERYDQNVIEIEGHTDNVPISNGRFESNDVLSMYRALSVADYIRSITDLNPAHIKSSGRGEYMPIADNTTPEGRTRNRRVVIKIYNSYSSDISDISQ